MDLLIVGHSAYFSANLISSALNLWVSSKNKLWPLFSKATMCEFEIPAFICSARSKEHILSFLPCIINVGIVIFTRSLLRSVSVSYTHLRAHETRHDLVCRLLLEKKKKK